MTDRTAIVTARGSGMRAAAAHRLAAVGCKVAILSSSGAGSITGQNIRHDGGVTRSS